MAYVHPSLLGALLIKNPRSPLFGPPLIVRLICGDCRGSNSNVVEEVSSGDIVCGNCGLVLGDRFVDPQSEWRTFADDDGDDPSRVGAASGPLMEGMEQLNTIISCRDGRSGMARELQHAASRSQDPHSERNLLTAFRDISSRCAQFCLPETISDIAKHLYKRSDEEKLLQGKPLDAVIAACIFIACRQAHVSRTFREICNLTHVSKKTLGQCHNALKQAFNLTSGASAHSSAPLLSTRPRPENLLVRFCNHLDLPANFPAICSDIIIAARKHGIGDGRSPDSIAGGAIYFTCRLLGKVKSAKDISAVAGIRAETIKLVYRLYHAAKEKLVKGDLARQNLSRLKHY